MIKSHTIFFNIASNSDFKLCLKSIALFASCFYTISCTTNDSANLITVSSIPTGAFVEVGYDKQSCTTPCTIKLDQPQRIEISKEGYEKKIYFIRPGTRNFTAKLELIAATQGVETTQLPELR